MKSVEDDFAEFDRCQTRLEFLNHEEPQHRDDIEEMFYNVMGKGKTYIKNESENRETKQHTVTIFKT